MPGEYLLVSVGPGVVPRRMFGVFRRMQMVTVRRVRVVGGLFVVAFRMVLRGFTMVACGVLVMLGGVVVMFSCFVRHGYSFCADLSTHELFAAHMARGVTEGQIRDEYLNAAQ